MLFKNLSILALAACVAAQDIKWTKRASPDQLGLLRRDGNELGYEPETTECDKEGDTCAEACGDGYEQCKSADGLNHCYNPAAGEVCCEYPGAGTSCEASYFCAHPVDEAKTFCCKVGSSLDECAAVYSLKPGALAEDPPVPTITSTSTIGGPTATSKPEASSPSGKNGTDTKGPAPPAKVPGSGAASFVPATGLVLVAAFFATLL